MFILFYITVFLLFIYALLIGYYERAWKEIKTFGVKDFDRKEKTTRVSVIVPARNEEHTIEKCLDSLSNQFYPENLLEIIVVNDHSTDNTEEKIRNHAGTNIKLINLADFVEDQSINSYKKKAIEIAVAAATGELIVTTDADCTAPNNWINTIAAFYEVNKAAFIAAPVKIESTGSFLSIFQSVDFLTLQGITGASVQKKIHSMCNGANLAYQRNVFYDVKGFQGIDQIASGDDMLLMYKIFKKYPAHVYFLKSRAAIVTTSAAATWNHFFQQRIRWASKADKYDDKRIFPVLLLVFLLNLFLLVLLTAGIFHLAWIFFFIVLVISKTIIEYSFVRKIAVFFNQVHLMVYFPFLQPVHIIYTVLAGFLGKFGRYEWKNRKVR